MKDRNSDFKSLVSLSNLFKLISLDIYVISGETIDGTSLVTGSHSNANVLTTAAMADVPVVVCLFNQFHKIRIWREILLTHFKNWPIHE